MNVSAKKTGRRVLSPATSRADCGCRIDWD
jgi:hypothetical protein